MNKKHVLAAAVALALLAATPTYADEDRPRGDHFGLTLGSVTKVLNSREHKEEKREEKREDKPYATSSASIHGTVAAINGSTITLTGENGAVYTVNAANATFAAHEQTITLADIRVGDMLKVKGSVQGTVFIATRISDKSYVKREALARLQDLRAGIVTSVSNGSFSITRFGMGTTATVSTNASTTVKINGKATTTAAITPGAAVVVVGSSSTSTPDSITGTVIHVITKGFGWLKHFVLR